MRILRSYRHLILFTLPALFFYGVFVLYPLVATLQLSLYKDELGTGAQTFVGLDNFVFLFTNSGTGPAFWRALGHNIEFFLIHLLVELPIAMLIAVLLTSESIRRYQGIYRTLLFVPTILSVVITAFIWRLILNPLWGLVEFPLLGDETTALPTVALLSVWQYVGVPMIFFYVSLLAIPRELLESARLDGAGPAGLFWRIKLPLIAPIVGLNVVLTYIFTFVGFDMVYALGGVAPGPNYATDILGSFFYRMFYGHEAWTGDPNLGAAVGTTIFFLILGVTVVYFLMVQRRTTSYEL